jgi:hypothetical protein
MAGQQIAPWQKVHLHRLVPERICIWYCYCYTLGDLVPSTWYGRAKNSTQRIYLRCLVPERIWICYCYCYSYVLGRHWPVSCEREFSSLQGKVSFTLQPSNAVFLLCKRRKKPFAKESRSHDTGHCALDLVWQGKNSPFAQFSTWAHMHLLLLLL